MKLWLDRSHFIRKKYTLSFSSVQERKKDSQRKRTACGRKRKENEWPRSNRRDSTRGTPTAYQNFIEDEETGYKTQFGRRTDAHTLEHTQAKKQKS
jgi:hypothetical protein